MLEAVEVPSTLLGYVKSFYSKLFVTVTTKSWKTLPIPFLWGVFQGDTMSPMMFLLAFNPLLQLATDLNHGQGYVIQLPLPHLDDLASTIYVKWLEQTDDPPGWYRAVVSEYFQDGSCKLVYDDNSNVSVFEIVDLNSVEWMPCAKRAKRYVPLDCAPKSLLRR